MDCLLGLGIIVLGLGFYIGLGLGGVRVMFRIGYRKFTMSPDPPGILNAPIIILSNECT